LIATTRYSHFIFVAKWAMRHIVCTAAHRSTCGLSSTQVCCKGGGGAANNWAYGYCCYGPKCADAVLAAVSREAEQCDHLGGLVVLHSAAGNCCNIALTVVITNNNVCSNCELLTHTVLSFCSRSVCILRSFVHAQCVNCNVYLYIRNEHTCVQEALVLVLAAI
jgi:Tubulin/FtsZ family, GTPase domain